MLFRKLMKKKAGTVTDNTSSKKTERNVMLVSFLLCEKLLAKTLQKTVIQSKDLSKCCSKITVKYAAQNRVRNWLPKTELIEMLVSKKLAKTVPIVFVEQDCVKL